MRDVVVVDDVLELSEVASMPRHIRRNDQANYALTEQFEFFARQLLEEVELVEREYSERLGRMERLLHGDIVRIDGALCHCIRMVAVGEAVMTDVVADSCNNETEAVEHVQVQDLVQLTVLDHVVAHLCNIDSVQIIVVLDIFPIRSLYLFEELAETTLVHNRQQVKLV